ncbi:ABC transporter permease [Arhodomonas sp. AD133]|uniref:ABC transporter permease n=1 Tax=Arhodomonas sp. AD133 TaxID=3415009 RepID=UPI003EBE3439
MIEFVKELWGSRYALQSQFYVNIKTTVATTRLGVLWWILDPLFLMLIYYFVVKVVFDRGGEGYHLFALCGIVTWQAFGRSVNLCTGALTRNAALIKQAPLPMTVYVIISPVVQVFFYLIGLSIILVWNWDDAGWHSFSILAVLPVMVLVPFAIGLFLSVFEVFSRDTGKLVTYLLRFGFYLSPVLYSPDRVYGLEGVPEWSLALYEINPMVHIITWIRDVLFYGKVLDWSSLMIMLAITLAVIQVGLSFFRVAAPHLPKRL